MSTYASAQGLVALLCLASQAVNAGLTLNMVENLGNLFHTGQFSRVDHSLSGVYAHSLIAMGAVAVFFGLVWVMFLIHAWRGKHKSKAKTWTSVQKTAVALTALATMTTIVVFGLNLHVLFNFGTLEERSFEPEFPYEGQNFALRGAYGISLLVLSAVNVALVGVTGGMIVYAGGVNEAVYPGEPRIHRKAAHHTHHAHLHKPQSIEMSNMPKT